jgi:hypothetical protein
MAGVPSTDTEAWEHARGDPERDGQAFPLVPRPRTALEQYLDREVERRARRRRRARRSTPPGAAASAAARVTPAALARAAAPAPVRATDALPWLMWRGTPVSPEFQQYAARVARGEACPPFQGRVLARSVLEVPVDPTQAAVLPRGDQGWSVAQTLLVIVLLLGVLLGAATTVFDQRGRQHEQAPALQAPLSGLLRPDP